MMGVNVMKDPEEVKSQQASFFTSEASKIVFQFRVCTVKQDEVILCFFFYNMHKEISVLCCLKEEDGSVTSCQPDILRVSKSFYASLYETKPTGSTASQSSLSSITEVLDHCTWEKLDETISLVTWALPDRMISESLALLRNMITYMQDRGGGKREDRLPEVLGIWFRGAWTRSKSWEEQKLVFWEHRSLSIVGKNLVIRDFMDKALARCGVERVGHLNLMVAFVCGCMKLCIDPQYTSIKRHEVLRFYLFPVLKRIGLASLLQNTPSSWTVPYLLSFLMKFAAKNTFHHQSIRKWSARSVLEMLREKERLDPVAWFPEQTVKGIGQNFRINTKTSLGW
eukprot:g27657.t1